MHPTQRARKKNMDVIRKWIDDAGGMKKVNTDQLIRKATLNLGCTRRKALEYLTEITGDE